MITLLISHLTLLIYHMYILYFIHLLHLAYAARLSLIHLLICTYSHSPFLDLCVLGSCWGIVRLLVRYCYTVGTRSTSIEATLTLTFANHVYVTNNI